MDQYGKLVLKDGRRLIVERIDDECYRWTVFDAKYQHGIECEATVSGAFLNERMAQGFVDLLPEDSLRLLPQPAR